MHQPILFLELLTARGSLIRTIIFTFRSELRQLTTEIVFNKIFHCAFFIEDGRNLPCSHPDRLDKVDGVQTADALDILRVITQLVGAVLRQPLAHRPQSEVVESELSVSSGRRFEKIQVFSAPTFLCKVALENVLERVPGVACLDVMEGVVCGEQDERLEREKHPGIVSQQLGQECRSRAPGGWAKGHKSSDII